MKALSIKQPWAGLILTGIKSVENRSWRTDYRGDLVVHSGMSHDKYASLLPQVRTAPSCRGLDELCGVALGIVELTDCVPIEDCQLEWAYGPWCWLLRNPRIFVNPIFMSGSLRLFNVPDGLLDRVESVTAAEWLLEKQRFDHEHAMGIEVERTGKCPD